MALIRTTTNAETFFDEEAWKKVETAVSKFAQQNKSAQLPKVHCYIPICAGHRGAIEPHDLLALVKNLQTKAPNVDFTLIVEPRRKNQGDVEDPYDVWMRDNDEVIKLVGLEKIVLTSKWRETPTWKQAALRYQIFRGLAAKKHIVEKLLDEEAHRWMIKQFDTKENIEAVKEHILNSLIDCLSWMTPADATGLDQNKLSVLVYLHGLPNVIQNALKNAKTMDYKEGSLVHIEPKFRYVLGNEYTHPARNVKTQDYLSALEANREGYSVKQKEIIEIVVNSSIHNPELFSKTVEILMAQAEKNSTENKLRSVPVPIGKNPHTLYGTPAAAPSSPPKEQDPLFKRQPSPTSASSLRR